MKKFIMSCSLSKSTSTRKTEWIINLFVNDSWRQKFPHAKCLYISGIFFQHPNILSWSESATAPFPLLTPMFSRKKVKRELRSIFALNNKGEKQELKKDQKKNQPICLHWGPFVSNDETQLPSSISLRCSRRWLWAFESRLRLFWQPASWWWHGGGDMQCGCVSGGLSGKRAEATEWARALTLRPARWSRTLSMSRRESVREMARYATHSKFENAGLYSIFGQHRGPQTQSLFSITRPIV